jgi:hypothetical protein
MRQDAYASAGEANKISFQWETRFKDCMSDYIIKNRKAPVSASELADAALSQCQTPLGAYIQSRYTYYFAISAASAYGTSVNPSSVQELSNYKAKIDGQELADHGKRLAINKII